MKNRRQWKFFVLFSIGLAIVVWVGCPAGNDSSKGPATGSSGSGEVVAKVGDVDIYLSDFEKQINEQNPMIRSRYNSLDQKQKLLDSLVEREAMFLEAKRLGLDQDPEVINGYKKILARQLVSAEFNGKRVKELEVSDQEIEQYYNENSERYHSPEKIRVHHLFLAIPAGDTKKAREVQKKANDLLKQLKANPQDRRLFIQLARDNSDDEATKKIGGDTNLKTYDQFVESYGKVVADAAFKLKQNGELSDIVKDEKGLHIIKQAGQQAAIDLPLEKVKNQIRTTLFARARGDAYKQFIEEVKRKVGVEVFADAMEKAKVDLSNVPPSTGQPPMIPGNPLQPQGIPVDMNNMGPMNPQGIKKLEIPSEKLKVLHNQLPPNENKKEP